MKDKREGDPLPTDCEQRARHADDGEWVEFADAMIDLQRALLGLKLRPVQMMILWTVEASSRRGMPYDKQSIALRIGQPRQTVYRLIAELSARGWLRVERHGHQDFIHLTDQAPDLRQLPETRRLLRCARRLCRSEESRGPEPV